MSAAIEAKDVWKSFRVRGKLVEAVKGIDMHIEAGEIFGFLGPNGAGKTTTLRLLTTLLTPDKGEISVAGYHLKRQSASVRKHIGYVSQARGSDVQASGRKNILLQGYAYGLSRDIAQQRTNELIEAFELTGCADRQVSTYSGGQRRRLDLALGIIHRPQILFLDEPGTGLDPQSRAHLWEEVRKLNASGTTIFLTTHYLEEADALCNRLAIIDGGNIVAEGTPTHLKQQIAGDVVTLNLDQGEHILAQARQLLETLTFVRDIQQDRQALQVYVEKGAEAIPLLLHLLENADIGVQSIALARPSLDDVFLRKTGRSLRDTGNTAIPA